MPTATLFVFHFKLFDSNTQRKIFKLHRTLINIYIYALYLFIYFGEKATI